MLKHHSRLTANALQLLLRRIYRLRLPALILYLSLFRIYENFPVQSDASPGNPCQGIDAAKEGAFPGTGRPDDGHGFTLLHRKTHVIQGPAAGKILHDILHFQQCHSRPPFRRTKTSSFPISPAGMSPGRRTPDTSPPRLHTPSANRLCSRCFWTLS